MSRILEHQIRGFARVYVESLPEVDIEEIRARPRQTGSPRARAGGKATRIRGRLTGRGPLIGLAAGVVVLMLGLGPILIFGSNETSGGGSVPGSSLEQPTTITDELSQNKTTGDPDTAPTETVNGPLSRMLAKQVSDIPELAAFDPPILKDSSEGGVDAAVVTFQAPDGAFVDIISQQLPEPLTPDSVGSPDVIQIERGPNGEQIIIKETEAILQVVGVDAGDWMVNIIVNRTASEKPREISSYTDWSLDTVRGWVIQLLEQR